MKCSVLNFLALAALHIVAGQLANTNMWLKADGIDTTNPMELVSSTKKLLRWLDKSNYGNTPTKLFTTSEQPLWVELGMNGLPAVQFGLANVTSCMDLGSKFLFPRGNGITIHVVLRTQDLSRTGPDANADRKGSVLEFGKYPTDGFGIYVQKGKVGLWTGTNQGGLDSNFQISGYNCTEPILITAEIIFQQPNTSYSNATNGIQRLWVNSKLISEQNMSISSYLAVNSTFASATPTDSAGPVTIGCPSSKPRPSGTTFFQGTIAELIWYDRVITVDDRENNELYLRDKYWLALQDKACVAGDTFQLMTFGNYKFYMNGRYLYTGYSANTVNLVLPRRIMDGDVLAVRVDPDVNLNRREMVGQVVDAVTGNVTLVTDLAWRCSSDVTNGWMQQQSSYIAQDWRTGTTINSSNGVPAEFRSAAEGDAEWIWSSFLDNSTADPTVGRGDIALCRTAVGLFITSIIPSTVRVGNDTTITINGRGFGALNSTDMALPYTERFLGREVTRIGTRRLTFKLSRSVAIPAVEREVPVYVNYQNKTSFVPSGITYL